MTVSSLNIYGAALEAKNNGSLDLADTFRAILVTEAHTPLQYSHGVYSDVSANEVANGGGYATGGIAVTMTPNRTDNVLTIDCSDLSWDPSTITAKYVVFVRDGDANGALVAGDSLLGFVDLKTEGGSVSSNNGPFNVTVAATGLVTETVPAAS